MDGSLASLTWSRGNIVLVSLPEQQRRYIPNDLNEETNETFEIKENDENDTCNCMFVIMFISRFL